MRRGNSPPQARNGRPHGPLGQGAYREMRVWDTGQSWQCVALRDVGIDVRLDFSDARGLNGFVGSAQEEPSMKLSVASLVCVVALFRAMAVSAGPMEDFDGDRVPHEFDNCARRANGPLQASNQVDTDLDGYGNPCDADYNNDPRVVDAFRAAGVELEKFKR